MIRGDLNKVKCIQKIWLASFSIPNLGSTQDLAEHLEQKTCPQARQWCCRLTRPKAIRQRWHTSPSAQSGATSASNMASASRMGGNSHPSAFIKLRVSYRETEREVKTSSITLKITHSRSLPRNANESGKGTYFLLNKYEKVFLWLLCLSQAFFLYLQGRLGHGKSERPSGQV